MAKKLEGEGAKLPATDEEVHVFRLQAVSLGLAGVMILLPVLSGGSVMKTPWLAAMVFALIVGLFMWQSVVNVRVWRQSDEFQRGQLMLVCAITFWVGQGALFLWAAAERLRLAPSLSSWDIVLLLMTLYVLASGWIGIKDPAALAAGVVVDEPFNFQPERRLFGKDQTCPAGGQGDVR